MVPSVPSQDLSLERYEIWISDCHELAATAWSVSRVGTGLAQLFAPPFFSLLRGAKAGSTAEGGRWRSPWPRDTTNPAETENR